MANGNEQQIVGAGIGTDAIPETDPTVHPEQKMIPVADTSGATFWEKIPLAQLQTELGRELPYMTEDQVRALTDQLAGAIRNLENRVGLVESTGGAQPGTPSGLAPTGGAGQVIFGFVDMSQTPPVPIGQSHTRDYASLPAQVVIDFGGLPAGQGWYIQVPSGVTISRFVNTSVPSDPQDSTLWQVDADNNRWFLTGPPEGTTATYTFHLASVGGSQQPSAGQQPQPSGNGGQQPPTPTGTPFSGVLAYGRINSNGVPQGTALVQTVTSVPATFADVHFPAGVDVGDGWYITVPQGIYLAAIRHRGIDGTLQDVTALWTYDGASRTHTKYGQFPGVPGEFTLEVRPQ